MGKVKVLRGRLKKATRKLRRKRKAHNRHEKTAEQAKDLIAKAQKKLDKAIARAEKARAERDAARAEAERAADERREEDARAAREREVAAQKDLDREREAIKGEREKIKALRKERQHANERVRILAQQIKWWVKRRTILRKKIKRAKARREPKFEPWMANGHEYWNLTPRAQKLLAIAVVHYGLVCTSITRNWGTGSFHERVPTRGFDCAGKRMTEFQRDLYFEEIKGIEVEDILELFGPDNFACVDNGVRMTMAEGSGLETLHDNHVHIFLY